MIYLKKSLTVLIVMVLGFSMGTGLFAVEKKNVSKPKIININTAQVSDFTVLPRIGEKIAKRIVNFRKKHGKFKRVEDLMKVKGIGEKTFNRFKKRLKVKNVTGK